MAPVSLSLDPPQNPLVLLGIPRSTQLKEPGLGQKGRSGSDLHTVDGNKTFIQVLQ